MDNKHNFMTLNNQHGIIIFTISLVYFLAEYLLINNTNLLSADGLWKSTIILSWFNGEYNMISKNYLYFPIFALLSNTLPDTLYIFQKIAIINCFFSAWSNIYIFFLVYLLTKQKDISVFSVIIHSGLGYVLGETVTSQDIIPAYTFFLGTFYYFFKTIKIPNYKNLSFTIICFMLCWLLHWTMMPSLILSILIVLYFENINPNIKRKYILLGLISSITLLIIINLIINYFNPNNYINLLNIIFPTNDIGTKWISYNIHKFPLMLIGIGYYPFFSQLITSFHQQELSLFLINWLVLLLLFYFIVKGFKNKYFSKGKALLIFLLTNFIISELANIFADPNDPEFQIQPMIWALFGYVSLIIFIKQKFQSNNLKLFVISILSAIPIIINSSDFANRCYKCDELAINGMKNIESKIDSKNSLFVMHQWNLNRAFSNVFWNVEVLKNNDSLNQKIFKNDSIKIFELCFHENIYDSYSEQEIYNCVKNKIDDAMDAGLSIIIDSTWDISEDDFSDRIISIRSKEQSRGHYRALKDNYSGRIVVRDKFFGNFYELYKK